MEKIKDYRCTYDTISSSVPTLIGSYQLPLPEAYQKKEYLTELAKAVQKEASQSFCTLPFCHTLEGEALGGMVNYGDTKNGPRTKAYICQSLSEVLKLPSIDIKNGRMSETLGAAQQLRSEGYEVVWNLSGPFTILNVLTDPTNIFRGLRKEPELLAEVCNKLGYELLRIVEAAEGFGVHLFSYADSAGGVNILGPRLAEQVVRTFTYDFMKQIEAAVREDTLIFLCPKTALALTGMECAEWVSHVFPSDSTYADAAIQLCNKITFTGQTCIKNQKLFSKGSVLKELKLL